jgi:geranylgeranylglycerol-phosphate geranylgeranyltransferase
MQPTNTMQQKFSGLVRIFRPELPLAAGLCVVIGQVFALGGFPPPLQAALGMAVGFFLSSSALIFNDIFDLEVDRVNAPQRPIPSGQVTPAEAAALGITVTLLGLGAAWVFGPLVFALSIITWALGFAYNWKLKSTGIWGNLSVSASVAMTFLIGGVAAGNPFQLFVWLFALFAFFFDLGEEIAADAMDAEGDRKRGSKSIAIVYGRAAALNTATALFGLVIVISFIPILTGQAGLLYTAAIGITDLLIVFFVLRLRRSRDRAEGIRAIRGLYLSASLGLLAFLIGSFFG